MTSKQATELIEQEIRWHDENTKALDGNAYRRGFVAGLRQARQILLTAAITEANHPEIAR